MDDLNALVNISKYAGERFDLVQAGGGNSSVKLKNGSMLIKASGFLLSDVEIDNGYSKVDTKDIANIVYNKKLLELTDKKDCEELSSKMVKSATIDKKNRPSIETLLHSFLLKYTLHTHPIVVNMIVIKQDWREILKSIFSTDNIALVEYKTPGIELAIVLHNEITKNKEIPKIIFLQNHGLIITSDTIEDIEFLTEYVVDKIEKYLHIDMNRYKTTSQISKLINIVNKQNNIAYLSEDIILNNALKTNRELFFKKPFCPDTLVYCGISSMELKNIEKAKEIEQHLNKYFETPKSLIFKDKLFIIAKNLKKAKEIEEVLKFHIITLTQSSENINFLDFNEMLHLSNWEAEQFRQRI